MSDKDRKSLLKYSFFKTGEVAKKKLELERYASSRVYIQGLGYYHLGQKLVSLLPRSNEDEFAYFKRVGSLLNGREFFLVFNDFHLIAPRIASWAVSAASITSLPDGRELTPKPIGGNNGYDLSLIVGDYNVTPMGVHADPNFNFLFPLFGPKVIRGWSGEYMQENYQLQNSLTYESHKSTSVLLSAKWGEYMYWPPDFWHVGEGRTRSKSIAVGLGVMSN